MVQFSLRSLLVAAIVLSNCITWTASRHHYTHNVSGHRSRHRRQGKGLYLMSSYVIPGGEGTGWGEWGETTPCSRTCGGGVASQKRICLQVGPDGQPQCTGGDTKYFSCQTQDCPPGSMDFRAEQCAYYNNVTTYRGTRYKWVPYTKGPNPCELNCMPPTERFYYRHKDKVIDGTRCNDESFDVCVDGTCQPVGCDMMLGSNAREDKCRNCRGNGKNCYTASGVLDTQDLIKGYNDMMLIPEGATTIVVMEVKPSNNYLALRAKNGTYYLNGDYHIDFPRSMMIAGALWYYERSQQGFAAPDKLRCLGPINEPIYVSLLLQSENVGIEYEYSLPSELAPRPTQKYNWVHEDFSHCSATCGGGYQTRNVTCRTELDLEQVDDALCDIGLKPATNQSCNTQACPAQWVTGAWEPCSKRCGEGGTQSRDIRCEKIITNGFPSVVSDKECFDLLGPKPEKYQECNVNTTCPKWFTEPWKPCDTLYGQGKQTRRVICYQKDGRRIDVLEDSECADEKPETERTCMVHPDTRTDWMLSEWVGCDTCMSTVRTRVAKCTLYERVRVDDEFCAHHPVPALQEPCDPARLPPCEVQWYTTQWGKCSVKCGEGTQFRRVFCGIYLNETVIEVDEARCSHLTKYNDTRACTVPKELCPSQWYASRWTKCSKDCGEGVQTRRVMCMRGDQPAKDCVATDAPESTQTCNTGPCNEDEIIPLNPKSPPILDQEDCDYDEDYPEVGLDIVLPLSGSDTTLGDMLSDSLASDVGSGMTPLVTGDGFYTDTSLASEEFISSEGSGSGSSSSWFTDTTDTTDDFTTDSTDFSTERSTVEEPTLVKKKVSSDLAAKSSTASVSAEPSTPTNETESTVTESSTTEDILYDTDLDLSTTESVTDITESTESSTTKASLKTDETTVSGADSSVSTIAGETTGSESTESTVAKDTSSTEESGATESTDAATKTTSGPTDSTVADTGSTPSGSDKTTSEPSGTTETGGSSVTESSTTEEIFETVSDLSTTTESTSDETESTDETKSTAASQPTATTSSGESTVSESTESTVAKAASSTETSETSESSESTDVSSKTTSAPTDSIVADTELTTTGSDKTTSESSGTTESTVTDSSATDTSETVSDSSPTSELTTESTETSEPTKTESTPTLETEETKSTVSSAESETTAAGETTGSEATESTVAKESSTTEASVTSESTESTVVDASSKSTIAGKSLVTDTTVAGSNESSTTEEIFETVPDASTATDITGTTESSEPKSSGIIGTETTVSGETSKAETTTSADVSTTEPPVSKVKVDVLSRSGASESSVTEKTTEPPTTESTASEETTVAKSATTESGVTEEATESTTSGETAITKSSEIASTKASSEKEFTTTLGLEVTTAGPEKTTVAGAETSEPSTTSEPELSSTTESEWTNASTTEGASGETTETSGATATGPVDSTTSEVSTTEYASVETTTLGSEGTTAKEETETSSSGETTEISTSAPTTAGEAYEGTTTEESSVQVVTTAKPSSTGKSHRDWSSTVGIPRRRKCKKRQSKCGDTMFGCCPDRRTPAKGPYDEGCPRPRTCKESEFGCCPDEVSPALGLLYEGCPPSQCAETLFGCCLSDNQTAAEGNDQEGCPPPPPACKSSRYGCCADGELEAKGPEMEGCPENTSTQPGTSTETESQTSTKSDTTTSEVFTSTTQYEDCFTSEFGCCYDNETFASAPGGAGCPCNATEFGCCSDGVSPAKGVNLEGCPTSCSTSKFGCCPDGKTPAHGPDNEGCCLLYAFGCCPDNYKPAEGPHLEGCGCQYARFGCCPDNATLAKGPNNQGCGCQYTTYGCCPDRHTEAAGSNYEGCGCHTYQFGCCLDGVTIAKGPNNQGCDCHQSQYGCCGDGKTPATGPERGGCDCASSEFGCCPDGQSEAKGHKFFGCSDIPINRQAACSQPTDRGSCRNFSVYWYYDLEYGGCSRFWYGGCEGNGNRFATKEECEDICVQPAPKDACNLPKVKGACMGYNIRWYYDSDREECSQFVFGGCLGNANNFESRELCQSQCQPTRTEDQCNLPIERGSCAGNFGRWGFNSETRRCEQFIWGGCEGNTNRFSSEAACIQRCDPPGTPKPQCKEEQNVGNCTEQEAAWSFSQTENRCVPFYYTGCAGNGNRFETEQDCAQTCPSAYVPDICTLPGEIGDCSDYRENWFYDTAQKRCRPFYYGGCGGNANNFASEMECERRCSETQTTTTVQPTEPAVSAENICFREVDPGPCTNMSTRWTYDYRMGRCIEFQYGGCGGNQNNFPTEEHCQYYCKPVQDICQLPMRAGPCEGSLMRWFYDPITDSCSQFTYGGCEGNDNRFESRDDCERRCRTGAGLDVSTSTRAPAPTVAVDHRVKETLPSECYISPSLETCVRTGQMWYLDPSLGECVSHDNLETGDSCRNTGVFPTQEACERSCGAFRNINVCRHDKDPGPCQEFVSKYYFDAKTGRCKEFAYGGCHGGPNRFSTVDECLEVCRPEVDPCKQDPEPGNCVARYALWYYDHSSDECMQFIYGGCGGNDNRFETKEDCEHRCRKRPVLAVSTTTTTTLPPTRPTAAATTGQPIAEECRTPDSLEPCGSNITVYYFDHTSSKCIASDIGGCRYANSYRTEEECERRCGAFKDKNVCGERLDPGPCRASIPKFYWDMASGSCQSYAYGGCGGSANRFSTIDECEEVCGTTGPAAACLQAVSLGSGACGAPSRRWHYSVLHADCLVFVYQGCAGTANNFVSYEECADLCKVSHYSLGTNEVLPPDCSGYDDECLQLVCPYGMARATTPEGCTKCSCVEKIVDCTALNAECEALRCPYGIERTRERDGCEKCKCYEDPCLHKTCARGENCVPIRQVDPITHEPRFSASCRPAYEPNEVLPDCERYNAECARLRCEYAVQRTRAADGCERCACVPLDVDCAPLRAQCDTLKCNYGVEKFVGVDGCERCLCTAHPCDTKECGPGERCVAAPYTDPITHDHKYSAECRTVNKTGYCPPDNITADATCRHECNDDADCRGVGKCCPRGCSQLCLLPDPLTSPAPIVYTTTHAPNLPQAPQVNHETEPEVVAAEGGKATLRCLFHGNPPPKITWRRGEITIDGDVGRYRLLSDGALEIVSLYRNDSGVYICVAENSLGVATQEIQLQVSDPVETPAGIAGEQNTVLIGEIGKRFVINCLTYGYPEPTVSWHRGRSMVPYSSTLYEARGNVLLIRRLTYETVGEYACEAYNGVGRPSSWAFVVKAHGIDDTPTDNPYILPRIRDRDEAIQVRVIEATTRGNMVAVASTTSTTPEPEIEFEKPMFTVPVATRISVPYTSLTAGSELSLTCEVDGYPEPDVYWARDGKRIAPSDNIRITGTSLSRLTVSRVALDDAGTYECHAQNAYSSHYSYVQITVQPLSIPAKCTDNPFFANCHLIVRSKFCQHKYYSKFCCKSCLEAGQLSPQEVEMQADQPLTRKKK